MMTPMQMMMEDDGDDNGDDDDHDTHYRQQCGPSLCRSRRQQLFVIIRITPEAVFPRGRWVHEW